MKRLLILLFFILTTYSIGFSQDFLGKVLKEEDKDASEYHAKEFIIKEVLGGANDKVKAFYIDALAATKSGELTTIYYDNGTQRGLVLSFWEYVENDYGIRYYEYMHKNLDEEDAIIFFNKVDEILNVYDNYLNQKKGNNVYFQLNDIMFVISLKASGGGNNIRVFWKNFSANWQTTAFQKSKRRFLKKSGNKQKPH